MSMLTFHSLMVKFSIRLLLCLTQFLAFRLFVGQMDVVKLILQPLKAQINCNFNLIGNVVDEIR